MKAFLETLAGLSVVGVLSWAAWQAPERVMALIGPTVFCIGAPGYVIALGWLLYRKRKNTGDLIGGISFIALGMGFLGYFGWLAVETFA